ncbi:MAG TPA: hypothetical protein VMU84_08335, partial [Thermoanaerobaculia bacterium]|nr:hypothetical protein [Thermoanaerobaculia bacterium]
RRYCQSFANPDYIDIISFCEQLELRLPKTAIAAAAAAVKPKIRSAVIRRGRTIARSVAGANGLSIYFPDRPIAESYAQLEFAKAKNCAWVQFIEHLAPKLSKSQPPNRTANAHAHLANVVAMPPPTTAKEYDCNCTCAKSNHS